MRAVISSHNVNFALFYLYITQDKLSNIDLDDGGPTEYWLIVGELSMFVSINWLLL